MLPPSLSNGKPKPALTGALGDNNDDEQDGDAKGRALGRAKKIQEKNKNVKAIWDDHTRWGMDEEEEILRDVWVKRFEDACEAISIRDPSNQRGLLPLFAERLFKELKKPQTDWRIVLNDFVQSSIILLHLLTEDLMKVRFSFRISMIRMIWLRTFYL